MENHTPKFRFKLGLFVTGGIVLFILAIFIIGRQKNLFDPVITIKATFNNVSGLQVGNNVRYSGINVGTVEMIRLINDSMVQVVLTVKKDVKKFIKSDCFVSIGSEGLIGDRYIRINQGDGGGTEIQEGNELQSLEPVETDAIMASLEVSVSNAEIVSTQLAEIMFNINNGEGTFGRLINDSDIAENLNQTMINLKKSSKGLDENMNAAKESFLLKGYFKKKKKKAEEKKVEATKEEEEVK